MRVYCCATLEGGRGIVGTYLRYFYVHFREFVAERDLLASMENSDGFVGDGGRSKKGSMLGNYTELLHPLVTCGSFYTFYGSG